MNMYVRMLHKTTIPAGVKIPVELQNGFTTLEAQKWNTTPSRPFRFGTLSMVYKTILGFHWYFDTSWNLSFVVPLLS